MPEEAFFLASLRSISFSLKVVALGQFVGFKNGICIILCVCLKTISNSNGYKYTCNNLVYINI